MSRTRWILVGGAWSSLVFGGVFWLSFPSDAMAKRLSYQVEQASRGRYHLSLTNVKPWWLGLSADYVILSSSTDPEAPPTLAADAAGLRVGLLGLAMRKPTFTAYLRLGDGQLDVEAKASLAEKKLRALTIEGADVPATELLALLPGGLGGLALSGLLDLDVDLQMPDGLGKADGKLSLMGRDLSLDTVTVASLGWTDKEIGAKIDEIDLSLAFDDGQGTVDRGVFASTLADLDVEGEVDLDDELGRSRVDLKLVADVKDWSDSPLAAYRSLLDGKLREATWSDEKAHYEIDTTLGRFGPGDLQAVRERGGRGARADEIRTPLPSGPAPGLAPPPVPPPVVTPPAVNPPSDEPTTLGARASRGRRDRDREEDLDPRAGEEDEEEIDDPPSVEEAPEDEPPPEDEGI